MSELDEYPRLQRALAVIALRMGLKVTAAPDDVVRAVVRMADDNTGLRQALAEARPMLRNLEAEADAWRARALAAEQGCGE